MTTLSSLDPLVPYVTLDGFPESCTLLIANYVIPDLVLELFNETDTQKLLDLQKRITSWPAPAGVTAKLKDYNLAKLEIKDLLAKPKQFASADVQFVVATDAGSLQGVLVYSKRSPCWVLWHLISLRTAQPDTPEGIGTVLMYQLIRAARVAKASHIELTYLNTSPPFYEKFDFHIDRTQNRTMVKSIGE